tara:strand:+ start:514 stop:831 length:318 start_codon:yes stop_codon:yes gene_type:complete
MKSFLILFLSTFLLMSCGNGWSQSKKNELYEECEIVQNKIDSNQIDSQNICSCTVNEFISEVSWGEYQKMLKDDLNQDEKAFFSNKVQVVLNKIKDKCQPENLSK